MPNLAGLLNINKSPNWTSFDVVAFLRKITKIKKIGHCGTLDPFATGVLIVCIGKSATKKSQEFTKLQKTYQAEIFLGAESDTYDKTGKIIKKKIDEIPDENEISKTLKQFTDKIKQIPPMFSAKKVKGKKLYELARKGQEIEREPQEVNIYKIKLLNYKFPILKIEVKCSSGTYIRTLAYDIGIKLKTGAYLKELVRTKIGQFKIDDSLNPKLLNQNNWMKFLHNSIEWSIKKPPKII